MNSYLYTIHTPMHTYQHSPTHIPTHTPTHAYTNKHTPTQTNTRLHTPTHTAHIRHFQIVIIPAVYVIYIVKLVSSKTDYLAMGLLPPITQLSDGDVNHEENYHFV